jgi:hypothetical protein
MRMRHSTRIQQELTARWRGHDPRQRDTTHSLAQQTRAPLAERNGSFAEPSTQSRLRNLKLAFHLATQTAHRRHQFVDEDGIIAVMTWLQALDQICFQRASMRWLPAATMSQQRWLLRTRIVLSACVSQSVLNFDSLRPP